MVNNKIGNSRLLALEILERWSRSADFVDAIFREVLEGASDLAARDRHFVQELSYGVLRHLHELDFMIGQLATQTLDSKTKNILRLGIYQILFMRVADHAAVNESVSLAGRARSLVNAVLRRLLREQKQLQDHLAEQSLAARYSHPDFLVQRWLKNFPQAKVEQMLRANNEPPAMTIRVNRLTAAAERIDASGKAQQIPGYPEMRLVDELPTDWLAAGDCYMQDPSTVYACRLLAPLPGERILDACAAPGGKTSLLAEMMDGTGQLVAADSDPLRLQQLGTNMSRMNVENVQFTLHDWLQPNQATAQAKALLGEKKFDRILVDAPCTNTGVLRRRVDARWRLKQADVERIPRIQLALLESVLNHLKPGGVLVYSTCSIEDEENSGVIEQLTKRHQELTLIDSQKIYPWTSGYDGAFAALLERTG